MQSSNRPKPVLLVILDGWGLSSQTTGNAIAKAKLPHYTYLLNHFPHTALEASGESVGLPKGEDGNTETGHLNIGAGKIVYQDLARINHAVADGSFAKNTQFAKAIDHVKKHQSTLHLLGLVGSGGVHSSFEHLQALLTLAANSGHQDIALHLITDGRDSPPTSAINYIHQVKSRLNELGIGYIASIMGRYYAMDRDRRFERTEIAYLALTKAQGQKAAKEEDAILASYNQNITDEFIKPIILTNTANQPRTVIKENDAVIFFNFRIDRPRQLTKAFVLPNFDYVSVQRDGFDPYAINYHPSHFSQSNSDQSTKVFNRGSLIKNLYFVTMTEYEKGLPVNIAFPPDMIEMPLGKVVSDMGLRQLRMAETEKERFVTFYFNGQREDPFPGEDRIIIPSPPVPTYDTIPEMSSRELTQNLIERIQADLYDLIVINYANPDMVAHTGNFEAGVKACEITDENLKKLTDIILQINGIMMITADHGNVEEMIDTETGGIDTKHSTNQVPLIIVGNDYGHQPQTLPSGILADIAPTILSLMKLPIPTGMTGRTLI